MANKSKAIGTDGETRVVNYLLAAGIADAERLSLKGNKDQGDVRCTPIFSEGVPKHHRIILEVKAGKQTCGKTNGKPDKNKSYSRGMKEDWLQQAQVESENANLKCYLVICKFNTAMEDFEVWSSDGRMFWYLDDFVRQIGGTPKLFRGGKPVE